MFAIKVAEAADVGEVRRAAVSAASRLGFDETEQGKLAIATTEAATNLLKHAGGGEVIVSRLMYGKAVGLEMLAFDSGPGIADIEACRRDGHSTAGSPGTGLGAISRLSSSSAIYSLEGKGTVVQAAWFREKATSGPYDIAMIQTPKPGETVSGDFCAAKAGAAGMTAMIADGLGHAPLAADAAMAAGAAFHSASGPPTALMEKIHEALRGTRGAAVGIAELDEGQSVVRFCGVGNISGSVTDGQASRNLVSMNGIVGHRMGGLRQFDTPWSSTSVLILHSDGLSAKWDLARYPGIVAKRSSILAAALYRDFGRTTDDSSIVVAKRSCSP